MAITIIATAGAADANAYVTEAEQIAYMATRLNASAWTTLSGSACTEDEKRAMVEAARELTARDWCGDRVSATQALAFPRQRARDPDSPYGDFFDTTIVPRRVKDAACELAFQFLAAGGSDVASADPNAIVKRKKVGPLETEYFEPYNRPQGLARFPRVMQLIGPLLSGGSGLVVRTVKG